MVKYPRTDWIIPPELRIPDFIMCGAMKAGTSTVHYILNQHPSVHMPDPEIHFFDLDNVIQHPDFNQYSDGRWRAPWLDLKPEKLWHWYSAHFDAAKDGQVVGEDSTTYIASEVAAQRISAQHKNIKLLVLLRNPTARAYSHYWHLVRSGRAIYSFEDTIRYEPYSILGRSLYLGQLEAVFRHVPRDAVKVVLLEEFLANKQDVVHAICDYIGVDFARLPQNAIKAHKNEARIPRMLAVELLRNRLARSSGNRRYRSHLPGTQRNQRYVSTSSPSVLDALYRKLNPLVSKPPPKMNFATQRFLDNFFQREAHGLSELLATDVGSIWFDSAANT